MKEYVIVGDTVNNEGCLIYTCGKLLETAEKTLNRMLNNPNWHDKVSMKGHSNIRIEEVGSDDCWWNESCE